MCSYLYCKVDVEGDEEEKDENLENIFEYINCMDDTGSLQRHAHLAGSIISCSKNPILNLLSMNIQDFNAIWHLYNRLVLLEIIIFKVLHYFSYEE